MTDKTTIGDRMKMYESPTTGRKAFKGQPLVVRLDGKSFHTYTRGLVRPFDKRLSDLMLETTRQLVDRFQAKVGYTQSDEITLVWNIQPHETGEYPFDGRFQKLESLTAAYASAFFNSAIPAFGLEEHSRGKLPTFDSRAFVVPNLKEAYHALLWRQQDATKNAISMAAQSFFSHKSLQGMHGPQMQERLFTEAGVNFNDYPAFFKRGMFCRRVKVTRPMVKEDYDRIPFEHWPTDEVITRSTVEPVDIWLSKQDDPMGVLFEGKEPEIFV